jgi:hypothetical protein
MRPYIVLRIKITPSIWTMINEDTALFTSSCKHICRLFNLDWLDIHVWSCAHTRSHEFSLSESMHYLFLYLRKKDLLSDHCCSRSQKSRCITNDFDKVNHCLFQHRFRYSSIIFKGIAIAHVDFTMLWYWIVQWIFLSLLIAIKI